MGIMQLPPTVDVAHVFQLLKLQHLSARYAHWQTMATVDQGGVGYARLVVQLFASWMQWPCVWNLDDNVLSFHRLDVGSLLAHGDHREGCGPKQVCTPAPLHTPATLHLVCPWGAAPSCNRR